MTARISIKNSKLAFGESLEFLRFLQAKYPTPGVQVTFQEEPIITFRVAGFTSVYNLKGACVGKAIRICNLETTVAQQLRLIGHEYRHAMQADRGEFPDGDALQMKMGGVAVKYHGAAENDAVAFSTSSVEEFLVWRGGASVPQRPAHQNEGSTANSPAVKFW